MDAKQIRHKNFLTLVNEGAEGKIRGPLRAFAEKVGLSPGHASQIKNGSREIGDSVARRIEGALGLPKGWMDRPHEEIETQGRLKKMPHLSWKEALTYKKHLYNDGVFNKPNNHVSDEAFTISALDTFIDERILKGSFLAIDPAYKAEPDDIVLVNLNGNPELRKIKIDAGKWYFLPLDPRFQKSKFDEDKVIGIVFGSFNELST